MVTENFAMTRVMTTDGRRDSKNRICVFLSSLCTASFERIWAKLSACNEVHSNYVKCIIVYTHITLALYRLD